MVLANTYATDIRVKREAKTLSSRGYSVKVLCWDRLGTRQSRETMDNVVVRNIRFGKSSALVDSKLSFVISAVLLQLAIVFGIVNQLKKSRNLILHAHDFNTLMGAAIGKLLFRNRVVLVYDSHEFTPGVYMEWYGPKVAQVVTRLEQQFLRVVDGLVAANAAITDYLSRIVSVPAVAVYNCPEKVEIPDVSSASAKLRMGLEGRFVVLFAGRVRQDYDMDLLLETSRALTEPREADSHPFRFVFTDPALTSTSLAKRVAAEGLAGMFEFKQWIPYDELMLLYRASDLCFAVTRDLGQNTRILTPIKVFESMSCGLPVVVRAETLAARIVTECNCGIVVDGTETNLEARFRELDHHPEVLRSLGEAGRRAFLSTYNWERMGARLLGLYNDLARKHQDLQSLAQGTVKSIPEAIVE